MPHRLQKPPLFPYTTLFRSSGFEAGILATVREVLGAGAVATPPCARAPRGRGHTWVEPRVVCEVRFLEQTDRKSTRLNSSHVSISYAVFCVKKKNASTIQSQ